MLEKIFTGAWTDTSRYSVPGLIVMALSVAVCLLAEKFARGNEKLYYALRLGGLIAAMLGAVITVRVFG